MRIVGGELLGDAGCVVGSLVLDGGRVAALVEGTAALASSGPVVDASGLLVAPGYIDLQINGGFGIDLASQPERLWELGAALPRHGVTAFLPTLISGPVATTRRALAALSCRPDGYRGAEPLGLHLEGPMINPRRAGAHPRTALGVPSLERIETWSRAAGIRLVTIAPELDGALEVIGQLVERGIAVSVGHTTAGAIEARAAILAGATMVTHIFNAMEPLGHRQPNLVGVALTDERLAVGLIADGIHLDDLILALIIKAKGPEGVVLVTDAVAAMGCAPGSYEFAGRSVTTDGSRVRLADGTLAGSVLTMDQAVRNLGRLMPGAARAAVQCATSVPARLIAEAERGQLTPGSRADLVLLDEDLRVVMTFCGGERTMCAAGHEWRVV